MLIEVQNLNKSYRKGFRKKRILKNITFQTVENKIIGVFGEKGSGKTTLLKVIAGITTPDPDYLRFNICGCEDPVAIKNNIGFWPAMPAFLTHITTEDLLVLSMLAANGRVDTKRVLEVLDFVGLREDGKQLLKDLPLEMVQLAGIAQGIVQFPKMLLLDEPLNSLNLDGRKRVIGVLEKWHKEGNTVIFSTNCLADLNGLCTDVILLKSGEILRVENLETLRDKSGYEVVVSAGNQREAHRVDNRLDLWTLVEEIRAREESIIEVQSTVTDILKKYYEQ